MARAETTIEPPEYTEKEKAKARAWFRKAKDCWDKHDYDFAIESYVQGLNFWAEAVEEGLQPLRALAIARQLAGGKKPGMMESVKRPMSGKDILKCLLNAQLLLTKDPTNASYIDAVIKNCVRGMFHETLIWYAPKAFESLRKDKKINAGRFKVFRTALTEAAGQAEAQDKSAIAAAMLEQAVQSVEFLLARNPSDMALKDELRNISGRLTILKGKYGEAESFRESIQDADAQKLLHDAERMKQGEDTLGELIKAARAELEADPESGNKINSLVEILLKPERRKEEEDAIRILVDAAERLKNYSFKSRADEVRLRQLHRQSRKMKAKLAENKSEENQQQYRLAKMEERQVQFDVYTERTQKYPTDLKIKYKLGAVLFQMGKYDEAIPMLQAAQSDPRTRASAQLLIGRSFFEMDSYAEAVEVLREALEQHDLPSDDRGKALLYWLAQSQEKSDGVDDAKASYGKLLRMDYNYANGEARKRLDAIR